MEIGSSILASQHFLLDIKILPPIQSLPCLKMAIIAPYPYPKGYFFAPRREGWQPVRGNAISTSGFKARQEKVSDRCQHLLPHRRLGQHASDFYGPDHR
jgi:hypothetical protein